MKKSLIALLFFIWGAIVVSAQNLPTVRIVNNTGYDIYFLFVSPSESDEWGDDLLGDDILEDGKTFTYQLPQSLNRTSLYDFGVEDEEGDTYSKYEVKITNNARIVFTLDDLD